MFEVEAADGGRFGGKTGTATNPCKNYAADQIFRLHTRTPVGAVSYSIYLILAMVLTIGTRPSAQLGTSANAGSHAALHRFCINHLRSGALDRNRTGTRLLETDFKLLPSRFSRHF